MDDNPSNFTFQQCCVATAFTNRHGIYKFLEAAKALTVHKAGGCHVLASYFVRLSKLPLGFIHLFIWLFPKIVVPPNHPFNRVFHYKPSILGFLYFWKHPYIHVFLVHLE